MHNQTSSESGFNTTGNVSFSAANGNVTLEGINIEADNLKVKTNHFEVKGLALEHEMGALTKSANVGVGLQGINDVSCSQSKQSAKGTRYKNSKINVKHETDIDAESTTLSAANINTETLKGTGTLHIESKQDTSKSTTQSFAASSTGNVSYHLAENKSKQVNEVSGIHVRSDIKEEDFGFNEVHLVGASITSDGHNGMNPDKISYKTLKDTNKTTGFGISGNVNGIADNMQNVEVPDVDVSLKLNNYVADIKSTVHGVAGVNANLAANNPGLHTRSADGKKVKKESSIDVVIPVKKVKKIFNKGMKFFSPAPGQNEEENPAEANVVSNEQQSIVEHTESPVQVIHPEENPVFEESGIDEHSETEKDVALEQEKHNSLSRKEASNQSLVFDVSTGKYVPRVKSEPLITTSTSEPETLSQTSEQKGTGTFNPKLSTQEIGLKDGRHQKQIYDVNTGKYTTVEKELDKSAEKNELTGRTEVIFTEGGNMSNGAGYKVHWDPLTNTFISQGAVGSKNTFNLQQENIDLGFGNLSFAVNLGSLDCATRVLATASPTKITGSAQFEYGVMGPSIVAEYKSPPLNYMGLELKTTVCGGSGIGKKVVIGIAGNADGKKLSCGGAFKFGLFNGFGGQGSIQVNVGLDVKFFEEQRKAYEDVIESDPITMGIINKIKKGEWVSSWERDWLDSEMESVNALAQVRRWFNY